MADFFRGAQNFFDPSGKPQRDLDDMLDAYAKGGQGHKAAAEGMREVMLLSPNLKSRVLEAVRDGYITGFSPDNPGDNAAAGYNASSRTMHIRPQFNGTDIAYAEMMFVMGHETDHARSLKGANQAERVLFPAVNSLAEQASQGPRDYTRAIESYVNAQRTEEAQANIGGFNAVSSYVMSNGGAKKGKELEAMYEFDPVRMGDFIRKSGEPAQYALRGGLSVDKNFQMPKSEDNVEAMKGYYADKMINGDYMMYRQEAIKTGVDYVEKIEKIHGETLEQDRQFTINPRQLQAHASLNLPADGRYEVKGAPRYDTLPDIDLSNLGPVVSDKQQASSSVPLAPTQDDHPMFAQALTKVVQFDHDGRLGASPQELRNLAAALAVEADGRGLKQIDEVMFNQDKSGLIASQGSGPSGLNAAVDVASKSVDEGVNLAKLTPVQQLASSSQSQVQQESQVQGGSGVVQKV